MDNEWGAEVYGSASDRQQASIVFDVAIEMVEQCSTLKKRIKPIMSIYSTSYFWIPEDNLKLRVRREHVPYDV